ncbi:MAG: rhomboid family intramembrane serine protease [Acidimicrobiales bacterium]
MPDRYSFSSPWSRGNEPWFRVGQVDVTTTVAVIGVGLIYMLVWAIEGPARSISKHLWLISEEFGVGSVIEGQIWRLATWPVVNEPDIWAILLFAIFYMLGNQLENLMGRRPFMFFLLALTLMPAIVVTLVELILSDFAGFAFGLRFVELGVLAAFAAQYPTARFWPGIPAWIIAAVIIALDFLQALGDRNDYEFVMLATVIITSLIGFRSFGFANELEWIPRIPLPAAITGSSAQPSPPRQRRRKSRGRGRANLSVAPPPSSPPQSDRRMEMEIDALLDQVAEQGLDSLSKDQRKRLEDHSKRLRKRRGD